MLRELERAAHQRAGALRVLDFPRDLVEIGLTMMAVERRLGVKQVHLARPAIHEQMDDRARFGCDMRQARGEIGKSPFRASERTISAQQMRQRRSRKNA